MRVVAARSHTQNAFETVGIISDSHHPVLSGVCFLNDKEVVERLKVTLRTVQNYRDRGIPINVQKQFLNAMKIVATRYFHLSALRDITMLSRIYSPLAEIGNIYK